jgi:hypothetical protein
VARAPQVVRHPGLGFWADWLHQQVIHFGPHVVSWLDVGAQRGEKRRLQRPPHFQQAGIPLEAVVSSGESSVVQLIAAVESELKIVSVGISADAPSYGRERRLDSITPERLDYLR